MHFWIPCAFAQSLAWMPSISFFFKNKIISKCHTQILDFFSEIRANKRSGRMLRKILVSSGTRRQWDKRAQVQVGI
jgi:hypothetical protein